MKVINTMPKRNQETNYSMQSEKKETAIAVYIIAGIVLAVIVAFILLNPLKPVTNISTNNDVLVNKSDTIPGVSKVEGNPINKVPVYSNPFFSEKELNKNEKENAEKLSKSLSAQGMKLTIKPVSKESTVEGTEIQIQVLEFKPKEKIKISFELNASEKINGTLTAEKFKLGEIEENVVANGAIISSPFQWLEGEKNVENSLIWLSDLTFDELSTTRETSINFDFNVEPQWIKEKKKFLPQKGIYGIDLTNNGETSYYNIKINNEMQTIEVIKAIDLLENQFIVLANSQNPLILRISNPSTPSLSNTENLNSLKENVLFQVTEIQTI